MNAALANALKSCLNCQKPLEIRTSRDQERKKFCNQSCAMAWKHKTGAVRAGRVPQAWCGVCGEPKEGVRSDRPGTRYCLPCNLADDPTVVQRALNYLGV